MKMKITKGSQYDSIKQALENTDGQCVCVPKYAWTNDTLCMCKEFREQTEEGECHCGMWLKTYE